MKGSMPKKSSTMLVITWVMCALFILSIFLPWLKFTNNESANNIFGIIEEFKARASSGYLHLRTYYRGAYFVLAAIILGGLSQILHLITASMGSGKYKKGLHVMSIILTIAAILAVTSYQFWVWEPIRITPVLLPVSGIAYIIFSVKLNKSRTE